MATLTPATAARSANPITFTGASPGGDEFANGGTELLLVRHTLGFCSVEMLRLGDVLLRHDLTEETVANIERFDGVVSTVAIHVPGTNTYVADGIWAHNDLAQFAGSASSSSSGSGSSSASDSGKSSGSSFSSSSSASSSSGSSSGSGVTVPF